MTEHLPDRGIVSEAIINRHSVFGDHTAYWKNKPEFVSRVVKELDMEAELLQVPDLERNDRYRQAITHHRRTIRTLSAVWWLMVLVLGAVAITQFSVFARLGNQAVTELRESPLDWAAEYVAAPGAVITWLTLKLTGDVPTIYPDLGYASLAVIVILLLTYLWWRVAAALLEVWDGALLMDFMEKRSQIFGPYGALMIWPSIILFGLTPVLLAYAVWIGESPLVFWLRLMTMPFIVVFGIFMVVAIFLGLTMKTPENSWAVIQAVKDACTPGSDDPAAKHRGFDSWKGMFYCFVCTPFIVLGLDKASSQTAADQRTSDGSFGWLIYAVPGVLLLIRLYRLLLQRGYARWVAAIGIAALLLVAWSSTLLFNPLVFAITPRLGFASMVAMVLASGAYVLVDRVRLSRRSHPEA